MVLFSETVQEDQRLLKKCGLLCSNSHSSYCTVPCPWIFEDVFLLEGVCVCVGGPFKLPPQGSMRKASSLSECRLLSVRRSGRRRRSLGKRAVSSGRWRVMSDRRARIRLSCSCSTAHISEIPVRSAGHNKCECEWLTQMSELCITCVQHLSINNVPCLPAETRTTAMKRAISSGSRPREPSFSLNSNMASRREPMPKARSEDRGYVWPFRKVTVWFSALNKVQNLTIRTCDGVKSSKV